MGVFQMVIRFVMVLALAAGTILVGALPGQAEITGAIVTTEGGPLNVRTGPATDQEKTGTLANGSNPEVACMARGEEIDGAVRTTSTWLRIGKDRWIANAYVTWSPPQAVSARPMKDHLIAQMPRSVVAIDASTTPCL